MSEIERFADIINYSISLIEKYRLIANHAPVLKESLKHEYLSFR